MGYLHHVFQAQGPLLLKISIISQLIKWYVSINVSSYILLVLAKIIVFLLLLEMQQRLRMRILYDGLLKSLGSLLYAFLYTLSGADLAGIEKQAGETIPTCSLSLLLR
jgi:hypothetical protein